ncbi:MAG: succinylglutamate desuccinylase/aspartoacylase family protein [Rhodospirillales bacterium]|nr:succinylglutamate desuccinylase/aspartoacylase family protein [Rhodospirillales bacterium]
MSGEIYSVELSPPDIRRFRAGNTGIPYVTTLDSGQPGPHVMVNALTHGNELCGAIALVTLFERGIRPIRGKLTLSFANVAAFETFDPAQPSASRFVDEDFNRVWDDATLDGPRDSVELRRARELRPLVDAVDLLLDIHSMQHSTLPLMMAGMTRKATALARRVAVPEVIVRDAGHAAGRRMRDYRGFADEHSPKNALLVECGQHWEARSAEVAVETTLRFLAAVGAIDPGLAPADAVPSQRVIEVTEAVTVATERFRFLAPYRGLEVIPKAGTVIAYDGEAPVVTPYDDCVLIMPSRRLVPGQTAVRLGRLQA